MGTSSLLGTQSVPVKPAGSDDEALGPSDSSDTGSDVIGTDAAEEVFEPRAQPTDGADISVDRIDASPSAEAGASADEEDLLEFEDPDLSFMDEAEAPDPLEDERASADEDPTDNEMAGPRPPAPAAKRRR